MTDHDAYIEDDEEAFGTDQRRRQAAADLYPADRAFYLDDQDFDPEAPVEVDPDSASGPEGYPDDPVEDMTAEEAALYAILVEDDTPGGEDPAGGAAYAEWQPVDEAEEGGRITAAAAGAASDRHIRFDPTQERGPEFFDNAHRHSRTVRRLKILLPTLAGIGVLGFLAFIQFAPTPGDAVITLKGVNVENKSVTMEKPHISGFDETRRSYEVRATEAIQDLNNPNVVTMNTINAKLGLGDGETARVLAASGRFDRDERKLVLYGGITIETTNGYHATLEQATIQIESGRMATSRPVEISNDQGTVKANGMVLRDEGKRILFRDGVKVVYTPPDEAATTAEETQAGTVPAEPTTGTEADPAT